MKTKSQAQVGLFEESINIYHEADAIGSTALRLFMESPKKFDYYREHGSKDSVAYDIGRALHCLVLEPELFSDCFAIEPAINKRTKAGKEEYEIFKARNEDKTLLTEDQLELVESMAKAVLGDALAKALLADAEKELSARVNLSNGLLVQCRADAIKSDHIIDLKTCQNVNRFKYDMTSHAYHIQAAFYYFILSSLYPEKWADASFYFIVVEKSAPFEVGIFGIDNATLVVLVEDYIKPALHNLKTHLENESKDSDNSLQKIDWLNVF